MEHGVMAAMAARPVVLQMNVHSYNCARKIWEATASMYGVERVRVSPVHGLVVVHGTADAYALRRRIHGRMKRRVTIISHGSAPCCYPCTTQYGPLPPPPPPPPPPPGCAYTAGGAGAGWTNPEPYAYAQHNTVPIL